MNVGHIARPAIFSILLMSLASASWAKPVTQDSAPPSSTSGQSASQQPAAAPNAPSAEATPAEATSAEAPPVTTVKPVNKEEEAAYQDLYDTRAGDPMHLILAGETFVEMYPRSVYLASVYALLTGAYFHTNQATKMVAAGTKALELDPDNVDVLPLMALAIPRQVTSKTPDGPQQLKRAYTYAQRGITLINALDKPAALDDSGFAKAKNEKLAVCHSALGAIDVRSGKFPEAIAELTTAQQLASTPDLVDYFLLGFANEQTQHFSAALDAFTKCAVDGSQLQSQCKTGMDDTRLLSRTQAEAPR